MDETLPEQDEIIEIDGRRYLKLPDPNGNTIREYYSHSGPGWDFRGKLRDPHYTQMLFGQTFTEEQVSNPLLLPDEPMYFLEEIE